MDGAQIPIEKRHGVGKTVVQQVLKGSRIDCPLGGSYGSADYILVDGIARAGTADGSEGFLQQQSHVVGELHARREARAHVIFAVGVGRSIGEHEVTVMVVVIHRGTD